MGSITLMLFNLLFGFYSLNFYYRRCFWKNLDQESENTSSCSGVPASLFYFITEQKYCYIGLILESLLRLGTFSSGVHQGALLWSPTFSHLESRSLPPEVSTSLELYCGLQLLHVASLCGPIVNSPRSGFTIVFLGIRISHGLPCPVIPDLK